MSEDDRELWVGLAGAVPIDPAGSDVAASASFQMALAGSVIWKTSPRRPR
jgi:hypothetical protein